ncbi:SH3 domain-containing protein [Devosia sp. FKR38]|uniref:SH3 domain-containing protein n=1 Tax=Devosia sp. FKR38 TaxID=2562312 RepID=UPI001485B9AA|nr:SH3 domain-containing protein [Devosia sp. FKR38]
MRKRYWFVFGIMALAALGNIIGGTDTPGRAAVDPAGGAGVVPANVAAVPGFEASLYVTANSLNLREGPSTSARVLRSLSRNSVVRVGERRGGWVNVSIDGLVGWVSADYLGADPVVSAPIAPQRPAAVYTAPAQAQSRQPVAQRGNDASCPRRQYCTRIGTCAEARWYLANCSWGALLDSDSDGVPCEAICR